MEHNFDLLEASLKRDAAAEHLRTPERFLQAVRSRRRRLHVVRAASVLTVLAIVCIGWMGLRFAARSPGVRLTHRVSQPVVFAGSSALRKLRELPPETSTGSGASEVTRVLDARDPQAAMGLGGL